MRILSTILQFRGVKDKLRGTLGLVPTMGYLHDGHLALIRRSLQENDKTAVSIFVNPVQFGAREDITNYPRDFSRDVEMLEAEGVDLVFAPSTQEMYPNRCLTRVSPVQFTHRLEGEYRPDLLPGVATIITKLFNICGPKSAYFGEKDAQQLAMIRQLVTDLNLDINIVGMPTVRELDGLAMSSRNKYLNQQQRNAAPVIYRALSNVLLLWAGGARDGDHLRQVMRRILEDEKLVQKIDYVSVVDPSSFEELDVVEGPALALTAVHIGMARLTDNVRLDNCNPTTSALYPVDPTYPKSL